MIKVLIVPKALKQFKALPLKDQAKVIKKLQILESSPLEGKKLSGKYSDLRSLRAWPYRIIYFIDRSKKSISIVTIAHRQGVYK